jgi:iron complex outermembrane recepter protein
VNLIYLIRLSGWGLVSAAYFWSTTAVQAQVTSEKSNYKSSAVVNKQKYSISAQDLFAQQNPVTRVTGVELKQTNKGLEVILKTAAGNQKLVPLILPVGNKLEIDILDATLAFSIRNGVTKTNPAPGIKTVKLAKVDESSIRLTITGSSKAPRAEIVPSRQNLVLSVTPEGSTAQTKPDEEIEIIATGEAAGNDDYFVPDAGVNRTDTPIIDTPGTVQVIPRQVIEDRRVTKLSDALKTAVGVTSGSASTSSFNNVIKLFAKWNFRRF